jgi:uncharacterized membrane protein
MRTERLQNLSDGIFAVALTLLVLNLPFLKGSKHLGHDLVRQWPYYAAYVVSFVTVGIVWINHHVMMDAVARLDRVVVELNLLLLLFVAVIPWPTGLLALNLRGGGGSAASVTYGVVMALMATSFLGLWKRLARAEELCHPHLHAMIRSGLRRALIGPVAYASGTIVALLNAPAAFAIYASVAVYYATSRRRAGPAVLDNGLQESATPYSGLVGDDVGYRIDQS